MAAARRTHKSPENQNTFTVLFTRVYNAAWRVARARNEALDKTGCDNKREDDGRGGGAELYALRPTTTGRLRAEQTRKFRSAAGASRRVEKRALSRLRLTLPSRWGSLNLSGDSSGGGRGWREAPFPGDVH